MNACSHTNERMWAHTCMPSRMRTHPHKRRHTHILAHIHTLAKFQSMAIPTSMLVRIFSHFQSSKTSWRGFLLIFCPKIRLARISLCYSAKKIGWRPGFIVRQQSRQRKKYLGFESSKINVITYSNCLRVIRMLATLHLVWNLGWRGIFCYWPRLNLCIAPNILEYLTTIK